MVPAIERASDEAGEPGFWREVRRPEEDPSTDERRAHPADRTRADEPAGPEGDAWTAEDAR
ncbi:hypothetical protein PWG71_25870 [Nocardiopsis sp. N85]|uniref:hypothetical protein n=1 Tax=Nocardiopsis sp. N85 TaxID=3029400 RepID=UPI00237F36EB|nr:hypothetical protein [Nocardiopsis sp. N85]MDE3724829.1 hypothetical protein [Nocardiopsis sp. N85]